MTGRGRGRGRHGSKTESRKSVLNRDRQRGAATEVLATWQCIMCDNACESDDDDDPSIECYACKNWSHRSCSKLTGDDFKILSKRPDLQWVCNTCMEEGAENRSRTDAKLDMILTMLPMIHAMNEKILNIEKELGGKNLEDKIEEVVDRKVEEAFNEAQEREKRKKNIIVSNVKESSKALSEDRKADDMREVKQLLERVTDITEGEFEDPIRLGKVGGNRPRLLRITLKDEAKKKEVLKKAPQSRLNDGITENKNKHYINADCTPREREENWKLRQELKQRTESGEEGLVIRNKKVVKKRDFDRRREKEPAGGAEGGE